MKSANTKTYPIDFPLVTIVVIGINTQQTIERCLRAVEAVNYPSDKLQVVYVDGGSTDQSLVVVRRFPWVEVVELRHPHPTPGRGRNAGWRIAKGELIQFLDGDTTIHPDWLYMAVKEVRGKVGAVCGRRSERAPRRNMYHLISHLELGDGCDFCKAFGGDVLIRREVMNLLDGYDEELIAGEDPDLSYRLRQEGYEILFLPVEMTQHDISMTCFKQYWLRSFRSGHAYAEVAMRYWRRKEKLWLRELMRITVGTIAPWVILVSGFTIGRPILGIISAFGIAFRGLRKFPYYCRHLSWKESLLYCLHLALVGYPQCAGALKYFSSKIKR